MHLLSINKIAIKSPIAPREWRQHTPHEHACRVVVATCKKLIQRHLSAYTETVAIANELMGTII